MKRWAAFGLAVLLSGLVTSAAVAATWVTPGMEGTTALKGHGGGGGGNGGHGPGDGSGHGGSGPKDGTGYGPGGPNPDCPLLPSR